MKMRIKSVVLCAVALTFCLSGWASAQSLKTDAEIEAMGYTHIYSLSIPNTPNFKNGAPYSLDNSNLDLGPIESVAYRLNLGKDNFCYTSFGAYTSDLTKIGVPTFTSQTVVQRYVQNLYYEAKSPTLTTTGTTVTQGNIEFWPWNYSTANPMNIPGASGANGNRNYDFGDSCSNSGNHGSMQVHDYQNKTTVFAFNRYNDGKAASLGIGNCTNTSYGLDWTMNYNSASYSTKQLDVFAKPVFSELISQYGDQYNNISGEVSGMKLVYKLDCPLTGQYSANNYTVNNATNSDISGMPLSRVGYYMVMEKDNGSIDYAYASFDAVTNDLNKVGLPLGDSTWSCQQSVNNMTVQSNVNGVINGSGITGNVNINRLGEGTNGAYSYFQIYNSGAGEDASQTVMALNGWNGEASSADRTIDMGIGNNTAPGGSQNYTNDGERGTNSNASQYTSRSLYVLAQPAIAPQMKNVGEASKYQIVQGVRLTAQMNTPWNNTDFGGVDYDIVDNVAQLQSSLGPLDRIGYYMEYAQTADEPLKYVFVSFDAMTNDISKIGVPTAPSGIFYQQTVKNLHVTTNVTEDDGLIYDPSTMSQTNPSQATPHETYTHNTGYLEFWAGSYTATIGNNALPGSDAIYDINDTRSNDSGHGSMQIHSLDTEQTIFALNAFNQTKQFGIGTNPKASANNSGSQKDWTFDTSKSGYAIANIYTFAKPVLSDMETEHFNVIKDEAAGMHLFYKLDCPLSAENGYSVDNYTVNNVAINANGDVTNLPADMKGMPIRVAYYMTLEKANGAMDYAYASFNSATNNVAKLGLPFNGSDWSFQQNVTDMTVLSNVNNVDNGTKITGNININRSGEGANGAYSCFQIYNSEIGDSASQTVMALNAWNGEASSADRTIDIGIGNNTEPGGSPNYINNGALGTASNASQYKNRTLYVMAEAAIAPGMANVTNGSDYTMVQGARLTTQMKNNWHNDGVNYDIVNNLTTLQNQGVLFDRVGYYMEYAATVNDPLTYVFVSFDAMTTDITKIGIPISSSGEYYQQYVNNLEVTTNVTASQGLLNDPHTRTQAAANTTIPHEKGFIEFCSSNYSQPKGGVNALGSNDIYDINDTIPADPYAAGHGSMQIHSIDTQQTIFALNHFNANGKNARQYGIGTNPNPSANSSGSQSDWTFDETKAGYAIANIYTFVHQVDALLTTTALSMYQRDLTNHANVTLSGTWAATNGVVIDTVQASVDGGDWFALTMNSDGTFTGTTSLLGGMHDVSYQAVDVNGNVVATKSGQVGVGEIFITAGQSNSTNYGDSAQASTSALALSYNPKTGQWQQNADPQQGPLDGSNRGSTWPSFTDTLSAEEGVPVATYSVGYGGTTLSEWINDKVNNTDYHIYSNLKDVMEFLNVNANGFAGILWHQGENDKGTAFQDYYDRLTTLIARTRTDSGNENLPWGVAIASADANGNTYSNVTNAQLQVIKDDPLVFLGVNTDDYSKSDKENAGQASYQPLRGQNTNNSIHLSAAGLKQAGIDWAQTAGEDIVEIRSCYWFANAEESTDILNWEINGESKKGVKLFSGANKSIEVSNEVQMIAAGSVEVGNGYSLTLTGAVTGSGELTKTGKGTLTLAGDTSAYTGKTTVSEGTLKLAADGTIYDLSGGTEANPVNLVSEGDITLNSNSGSDTKFVGTIDAAGKTITKTGNGTLKIFSGDEDNPSKSGSFVVEAGRLDFKGYYKGSLEIKAGAVLSPGNSIGTLNINGETLQENVPALILRTGSTLLMEVAGPDPDDNDKLIVSGDFAIEDGAIIDLVLYPSDYSFAPNETFEVVIQADSASANLADLIKDALTSSFFIDLDVLHDVNSNVYTITGKADPNAVPEPSTWALLILGAAGLLYFRKRQK